MTDLLTLMGDVQAGAVAGMSAALGHADRVVPGWSNQAYAYCRQYALGHEQFCTEDLRVFAHRDGFPLPPDNRAWGAVVNRAAEC